MGDCVNSQVGPDGNCPDGSPYTGVMDSGGAAPVKTTTPGFNWDATIASLLNQGVGIAKGVLTPPTYQSTYNPATGQTSTTIRGGPSAVGQAASPFGLGISTNTLLIGGAVVVGLLFFSSMSKGRR
jgi:hypothetical protein